MRAIKVVRVFHRLHSSLTHIGEDGSARMVNVSGKVATFRKAHARATVELPAEMLHSVDRTNCEIFGKKGPVFATAKIAGTIGCKKTSDMIPSAIP